jgi:hypothetical protein
MNELQLKYEQKVSVEQGVFSLSPPHLLSKAMHDVVFDHRQQVSDWIHDVDGQNLQVNPSAMFDSAPSVDGARFILVKVTCICSPTPKGLPAANDQKRKRNGTAEKRPLQKSTEE